MKKPLVLGIDIGGSHITTGVVDIEDYSVDQQSIKRISIDSESSVENILGGWTQIINESIQVDRKETIHIGIAMPGPFDYENGISLIKDQTKFKALYKLNIKVELAKRLNIQPSNIKFINDAEAFMQGEVFGGVAKGYNRILGLTLGTGLGSAISLNGFSQDAALWDSQFKDGIAEDYLSTKWFTTKFEHLTGKKIEGVKQLALIAQKDKIASSIFAAFGENLSEFLNPLIKENHTEAVVLGGNIAQAYSLFSESLLNNLTQKASKIVVKITELKEHASLIGAASCWSSVPKNLIHSVNR